VNVRKRMGVKRFDNGGILVAEILEDQNEKLSVFCYVSTNTKEIVEPIHDVVYHDYRKARIVYEHNIPETERWMYVLRSFD
jgi:hypothetical protein